MKFIKRDIPKWEDKSHEPSNLQNWYKVYKKLLAESANEIEADAKALEATLKGLKSEQAKHTTKQGDASTLPKLPKMGGMIYATSLPQWKKQKKAPPPPPKPSQLNFGAGSRTKTLTGAGVISKARKEAQQLSMFSHKNSKLAMPTHKLSNKALGVQHAPKSTVYDYKHPAGSKAVDPTVKQPTMFVPKRKVVNNPPASNGLTVEERERRLKTFTNPKGVPTSSSSVPSHSSTTTFANTTKLSETHVPSTTESLPPTTLRLQNMSVMSPQSTNTSYPNPTYRAPRLKSISPEGKDRKPMVKKRAPVDPFMPAKRRKIA